MLKKIFTIGFVFLLLCLQYARHLSYLGCKVVTPNNAQCSCEKILLEKEEDHSYAPNGHKHIKVEDFVQQKQLAKVKFLANSHYNIAKENYKNNYIFLFTNHLLKPPLA